MRIAVVDDEKMFQMQLSMMIEKFAQQREITLDVDSYSGGEEFIEALADTRYDVVFMDIFMPEMDGIATATKLRELTERTFLIFLTASDGHYPDAFALHAFDYVTKPFTIERISQVMTEVLAHTPMDESFVKFTIASTERKVYLKSIVAVTTDGHYLDITIDDGDIIRVRYTASQFLEMTNNDSRFIQVNRGIILNMDQIEKYDTYEIIMTDGTNYPVSVKKGAQVVSQINDYKFRKK